MFMTRKGLNEQAIDITPHQLADARKNVKETGLEDHIRIETSVHADDPAKVLPDFFRLLRSGGLLVLHEADVSRDTRTLQDILRLSRCQNTLEEGEYEKPITDTGFSDFSLEGLTDEVLPLWRWFGILGYVPYQLLKLSGVHYKFANVMAGVEAWLNGGGVGAIFRYGQ
ncbi:hypothetical protein N0V90_004846 [Kalmusia sp. IMI 367209]|nr:hypothetical protein N0V90_004846 [Kalmusia sp. IMI 367209]